MSAAFLGAIDPPPLPATAALYIDFDGTLIELAAHPARVAVPQQLPGLLMALQSKLDGALAIISGRRLADIDALLAPLRLAGAGVHGAELRLQRESAISFQSVPGTAQLAQELRTHFAADARLLIEDKGAAVALHYRNAPERAAECLQLLGALAGKFGLQTLRGHMVVEARPHDVDKGRALRSLAAARPFQGRTPVFVGDDVTDEDGFAAAAALGGYGVKVGEGKTIARYRCRTVSDVHRWLRCNLSIDA